MNMTFEQYILNPMGKHNAVLNATARESIRKSYMEKFDKILLRENGHIDYKLYKDKKSNTYWIYVKIPSEVVKNFYYDVILKFSASQNVDSAGEDLFKYNVKFYSNDPAFVFTYAHVFLQNDLFIKELSSKMSKEALRKSPKEKNPNKDIGYVKTIYFVYLLMQNKKLNKKNRFELESKSLDIKDLINSIEDADEKIRKRQEENKSSETKSTTRKPSHSILPNIGNNISSNLKINTTKSVGNIKSKSKINSIKSVNSIKTVKKK